MSGPSLPAVFISHGAPLFAIDPGESGPALTRLGQRIKEHAGAGLRGVVIMSPHWMAREPAIMSTPKPQTWHDFGGFPAVLYKLDYPAAGEPELAGEVGELLRERGIAVQADAKRPFAIEAAGEQLGLPPERVVVGGFSQGGIMSLSLLLTRPELLHAAMVMHSWLLREVQPLIAPPEQLRGRELWVSHGTDDAMIPVASAHQIRERVANLPIALTYKEYPGGHQLRPSELRDAMAWLQGLTEEG